MRPFYIQVGKRKLVVPYEDMTKTNGIWNFTQEFREAWLRKRYPELLPVFLRQCQQHEALFTSIQQHTKLAIHEKRNYYHHHSTKTKVSNGLLPSMGYLSSVSLQGVPLSNYCRGTLPRERRRETVQDFRHQKYSAMNPAFQKVIQKYNVLCLQHRVQPNSVALATSLNIAGFPANDPDDESYRNIPAYSNSRIGQIKNELMGIQRDLPYKAFGLGKIVHQQLLEPELCGINQYVMLTKAVKRDIQGMVTAAKRHPALRQILACYEKEQIFTWFDKETGAPCKSKVDLWREKTRGDHVIDLKTTRARNQREFEASARKYEYDRQGAFYMDGTGAKRFTLYGIQKVSPFGVFRVSFGSQAERIVEARSKYRFILTKAILNQIQP